MASRISKPPSKPVQALKKDAVKVPASDSDLKILSAHKNTGMRLILTVNISYHADPSPVNTANETNIFFMSAGMVYF